MTALVERQGPEHWPGYDEQSWLQRFMELDRRYQAERVEWQAAVVIAALRQPGADYRRGVEDAARVAEDAVAEVYPTDHAGRSMLALAASTATAIRALSDSIPDTKGGTVGTGGVKE